MKLVEMKCKNCGSLLKVNDESKEANCQYCGVTFKIDDEVQHVKYDDMEQAGYEFEKGKLRAQQEQLSNSNQISNNKNRNMKWLILGWIFLFPFMLTYYIAKSKKIEKKAKIIIITILWIFFFTIVIINNEKQKEEKKARIIKCYSEEVYNKLDELIGIKNIYGNFDSTYTCSTLQLRDKKYNNILIELNEEKELIQIKVGEEILFQK